MVPPSEVTFTVATTVPGGTVSVSGATHVSGNDYKAKPGDRVTLTATPSAGYKFNGWSDGNGNNPLTITVAKDVSYTPTFVKQTYGVTDNITNATLTPTGNVTHGGTYTGTLSVGPQYVLPTDITVSGGTKNYNSTTGAITVTGITGPLTFSGAARPAAASVDGKGYLTFEAALAVANGKEITLYQNATLPASLTAAVNINLNGKTLSGTTAISGNGGLTVKGGTLSASLTLTGDATLTLGENIISTGASVALNGNKPITQSNKLASGKIALSTTGELGKVLVSGPGAEESDYSGQTMVRDSKGDLLKAQNATFAFTYPDGYSDDKTPSLTIPATGTPSVTFGDRLPKLTGKYVWVPADTDATDPDAVKAAIVKSTDTVPAAGAAYKAVSLAETYLIEMTVQGDSDNVYYVDTLNDNKVMYKATSGGSEYHEWADGNLSDFLAAKQNVTMTLLKDIDVTAPFALPSGANLTLTGGFALLNGMSSGAMVTVPTGASFTLDGASLNGADKAGCDALKVTGGTATLTKGNITTVTTRANAVKVESGTLNLDGAQVAVNGKIHLGANQTINMTAAPADGKYIVTELTTTTPGTGVVTGAAADSFGRVKVVNSGTTLVLKDGALKTAASAQIVAMVKGTNYSQEDPIAYGYTSLADAITNVGADGIIYLVHDMEIPADLVIPAGITLIPAVRKVAGEYGTVVTIENENAVDLAYKVTVTDNGKALAPVLSAAGATTDPNDNKGGVLLNAADYLDALGKELVDSDKYSAEQEDMISDIIAKAKTDIDGLVLGTAIYGKLMGILDGVLAKLARDDAAAPEAKGEIITDGEGKGKAQIIVKPSSDLLKYTVLDKDGYIVAPMGDAEDGWLQGTSADIENPGSSDAALVFGPLDPTTRYTVITAPLGVETPKITVDPDDGTVTVEPGGVAAVVTPPAPVDPEFVRVTGDSPRTITIDPSIDGVEYAIVDKDGNVVDVTATGGIEGGDHWTPGNAGGDEIALTYTPDPDKGPYSVVTRTKTDDPDVIPVPGPVVTIPAVVVTPNNDTIGGGISTGEGADKGKSFITVKKPTKDDTKYAVVDEAGNIVAPIGEDKDGWLTGKTNADLTFGPLDPGKKYTVITAEKQDPADTDGTGGGNDKGSLYPESIDPGRVIGAVVVAPTVDAETVTGAITKVPDPETGIKKDVADLTVNPTASGTDYVILDPADGNKVVAGPMTGNGGAVTFPELEPGKEYIVATKPGETGTTIVTPFPPVDPETVTAADNAGNRTIKINPADSALDYAVVDKTTGAIIDTADWIQGNNGEITFTVPKGTECEIVTRGHVDPTAYPVTVPVVSPGTRVPETLVGKSEVTLGTDENGSATMTVKPTVDGTKYAVVDPEGNLVGGWKDGEAADPDGLTFGPLDPGVEYKVVTVKGGTDPLPATADPGRVVGPTARVPAVNPGNVAGEATKDNPTKVKITIDPTSDKVKYVITDASGNIVDTNGDGEIDDEWKKGGGKLVFEPLEPETPYFVVTVPVGDPLPASPIQNVADAGTKIITPAATLEHVDEDTVTRNNATGVGSNETTITVNPTVTGLEYAIIDKATGVVVAPVDVSAGGVTAAPEADGWVESTANESLAFSGLDANKEYEVVVRNKATADPGTVIVPAPAVTVPVIVPAADKVEPAVNPATGEGTITVKNPVPDTVYLVLDPDGKVVKKTTAPNPASEPDEIVFTGLLPGEDYKVVTAKAPGASLGDTIDPELIVGVATKTPAVDEGNIKATVKDDKAIIVIDPSDPNVKYAVVDPDSGAVVDIDGSGTADASDWLPGNGGPVTFTGLDPDKKYQIVTVPKDTADGKLPMTDVGADEGTLVLTPAGAVDPATVKKVTTTEEPITTSITIPTKSGLTYELVDENGDSLTPEQKLTGNDGDQTFTGLDPDKTYQVKVTKDPDAPAEPGVIKLPAPIVTVPAVIPGADKVVGGIVAGEGVITVKAPTDPDAKYGVLAPDGTVVGGWQTGAGSEGALTFKPVAVGVDYKVVTIPGTTANLPAKIDPDTIVGPVVTIPPVGAGNLTGAVDLGADHKPGGSGENKDTASITIDPTSKDTKYAVLDPDTKKVVGEWKTDPAGGPLTFSPLEPGKKYEVITVPVGTATPPTTGIIPGVTVGVGDGVEIIAPIAPVPAEDVAREKISGLDKLTVRKASSAVEYALADEHGNIIIPGSSGNGITVTGQNNPSPNSATGWYVGASGNNTDLVFAGLNPNKTYTVLTRKAGVAVTEGQPIVVTTTTGDVTPVGNVSISGKVLDKDGKGVPGATVSVAVKSLLGGTDVLTAVSGTDGTYTLTGTGVGMGDYAIYVSSDKGCVTERLQMTTASVALMDKNLTVVETVKTITGGTVAKYGTPLTNAQVTITDKNMGKPVTILGDKLNAANTVGMTGSTAYAPDSTKTTSAGGYVLAGLENGTYIVTSKDGGASGMTEIVVKDGVVTPNKAGGYRGTDIGVTPGGVITGKVSGLKDGEKATVSITVPVYETNGTTVAGTKTITAQAVGEGGYYQLAGVPGGTYAVTVAKSDKKAVSGTMTVSGDNVTTATGAVTAVSNKANINLADTEAGGALDKDKPFVLTGTVTDKDGKPVSGAAVTVYTKDAQGNLVKLDNTTTPEVPATITTGVGGGYAVTLPAGTYYVSADATVSGSTANGASKAELSAAGKLTTGTGNIQLTGVESGVSAEDSKVLTGTVKDGEKPVSGATVTVVKDGKVIATTKTDTDGKYVVGGVPARATISVTAGNKTGAETLSGLPSGEKDITVTAPADKYLVAVGPKGEALELTATSPAATGKTLVTLTGSDGSVVTPTVTDGKLDVQSLPAGNYTVTIAKDGMTTTKPITVANTDGSSGTITGGEAARVVTAVGKSVSGKVSYETGKLPATGATVTLTGGTAPNDHVWGESIINPNTGAYTLADIPDGVYTMTLTLPDHAVSGNTIVTEATVTVKNGAISFKDAGGTDTDFAGAGAQGTTVDNATVNALKVSAGTAAGDAATGLQAAIDKVDGTIADRNAAIKAAQAAYDALTSEQKKQIDPKLIDQLTAKQKELLAQVKSDDTLAAKDVTVAVVRVSDLIVEKETAKAGLEKQKESLIKDVLDTVAGTEKTVITSGTVGSGNYTKTETTMDVNADLALNVKEITTQTADVAKVEAAAKGATVAASFDVTVDKTVTIEKTVVETVYVGGAPTGSTETPEKEISTERVATIASPIKLTFEVPVPEELRGEDLYLNIIHVHGGEIERLPSVPTRSGSGTAARYFIETSSDKFSTYSIVYSTERMFPEDELPTENNGNNNGTGGGSGASGALVTVTKPVNGTVGVSNANPGAGEEFVITVKPDAGYVLNKLTVKDAKGSELAVTSMGGGKYAVTMPNPAGKLTVDATFKKLSANPHENGVSALLNVDDHIAYMKGRSGGIFAPAESMTRAEVAQLFYNLLKNQDNDLGAKASFPDVAADAWYAKAVNTLTNMGILKGIDGKFRPDQTITRAEFIAIAARFANAAVGGDTFSDVSVTHWAYGEIVTATAYGWIDGYGDGTFRPGSPIARSEAAKIVNRMLDRMADKAYVDTAADLKHFPDVDKKYWAFYDIAEATNAHGFDKKNGAETWK